MNSRTDGPPTDWKEARRLRAWELVQEGWKQKDVAAALGVTGGAVSQWVSKAPREVFQPCVAASILAGSPS